jgi:hypothetical protein
MTIRKFFVAVFAGFLLYQVLSYFKSVADATMQDGIKAQEERVNEVFRP